MTESSKNSQLAGQTALVTGAAQGLGLATAEELARRGAHVVLADLQADVIDTHVRRLGSDGLSVAGVAVDVTDSARVTEVLSALDRIDILVNAAGVGQRVLPVSELPDEEWDRVLAATLTGTFYCCRAAAVMMERQESGSIVNFASINGQNPAALVAAYNVAKAGVISLTRTMAQELAAYGVRVNAVAPGPVYTEFNRKNMVLRADSLGISEEEMIERVRKAVPLGRWGEPSDIACTVAFLCSAEANWITGEVMRVSGGMEGVAAAPPKRPRA